VSVMGLTRCYKTTVFVTFIRIQIWAVRRIETDRKSLFSRATLCYIARYMLWPRVCLSQLEFFRKQLNRLNWFGD